MESKAEAHQEEDGGQIYKEKIQWGSCKKHD